MLVYERREVPRVRRSAPSDDRLTRARREHRNRLSVLAVGIVGFVIPVLASKPELAGLSDLVRAAVLFLAAVGFEVVFEGIEAHLENSYEAMLGADAQASAIERIFSIAKPGSDEHRQATATSDGATKALGKARRKLNRVGHVEHFVFSALFLAGSILLIQALAGRVPNFFV